MRQIPFFGVVADPQSYLNVLYLLLAFPLGIGYFVFLVTGTSLGIGLAIIWVGIPILLIVLVVSWALCQFERALAVLLLKEDIPPVARDDPSAGSGAGVSGLSIEERLFVNVWRRLKAHLSNRLTWTGIVYLLLKFPAGIASFVVVVTLVSLTFAFVGAPLYYSVDDGIDLGVWQVDVLWEAAILSVAGVFVGFISLNVMNVAAFLSGRLARVMLGRLH